MKKSIVLLIALVFVSPALAYAASDLGGGTSGPGDLGGGTSAQAQQDTQLINPLQGKTLRGFVGSLFDLIITVGSMVLTFMVIYIGFLFVLAQGNAEKLGDARRMLLWTLVGGVVLLGAKGISLGVEATVRALGG